MFLKYALLEPYHLTNFTTTTEGGVSKGNYSTMNPCLYSNDEVDDVMQNQKILANMVGVTLDHLYIPHQTHQDQVRLIDKSFIAASKDEQTALLEGIDAMITQEKEVCIGITTADCVPILIYDPVTHALGCAHAGWKGTVLCIGRKMVEAMHQYFGSEPQNMLVGIGPSISHTMFEVGDEVGEAFESAGFELANISSRNNITGKLHIDLWEANRLPLLEIGIPAKNIEVSGICSYQNHNFFSARRQTIKSGRMLTGGVLK